MAAYVKRHIAGLLREYMNQFPCVLVLGARQTGKSTFLAHALSGWRHVDLEQPREAEHIARDVALYVQDHPEHVWFDEAQRAPELFTVLRGAIDRDRRPGRFVLSGSVSPSLVKEVSESLTGRAGVIELGPLSAAEQSGHEPSSFLKLLLEGETAAEHLTALAQTQVASEIDLNTLWLHGGYPEPVLHLTAGQRWRWFESYVRTLSERELARAEAKLTPPTLSRLLRMLAVRQGQVLNVSALARDFGATGKSIARYLDALEQAFLWRRTPPYLPNLGKRLVRSPKGYFVDSGLLHHLLDITSLDSLETHPAVGPSWEGWVIEQLLRQALLMEPRPHLYFWRTQAGAEVDALFELGTHLLPVEIKHAVHIRPMELRGLRQFLNDHSRRAPVGIVIYRGKETVRIDEKIWLVPAETACLGTPPR